MAAAAGAEAAIEDVGEGFVAASSGQQCSVCGYQNRGGARFCGMCGLPMMTNLVEDIQREYAESLGRPQGTIEDREMKPPMPLKGSGSETHHYHHHYHHFFPRGGVNVPRAESARGSERRASSALNTESLNRAEAGVRRVTQDWIVACNTRHLDDLLDLYSADAIVMRSNYPPVRGASAVREFFFAALEAGLGEVEIEPIRLEVAGDMAYETGRCKALVPGTGGKRREERAKYLWVFARESNGEWKLAADCWSSDLTLPGTGL